jgi:lipopolysaccharide transport system permease protein
VRYRDVKFIVPFLAQCWMYASPVAYSVSLVPERWRPVYDLNPLVAVIQGFRWALVGADLPEPRAIGLSVGIVLVSLVAGVLYFRRAERSFADII